MEDPMPLPVIFFGHGNPMNALDRNEFTEGWARVARSIPRPKAILCVSAHWYVPGTAVTAMAAPRTIHDFGGFPQELRDVRYPAPGSPALAGRVAELLPDIPVFMDPEWGLDHGTWSVLVHAYPGADIPVVQLAIDETKSADWHFRTAVRLRPLRDEGVLVLGSGNLVHNLHAYSWGRRIVDPYDWALRFETRARELLSLAEFAPLVGYESLGRDALLSIPTPDHYLPLVYAMGLHVPTDTVTFPVQGFDGGSVSMLSVRFG
jgi:4,5-DOPA dioxygenase extradiol